MNTSITSKEARETKANKNSIEPHRVLVTSVLWFDKLSVPALWHLLKNGGFRDNASIRFMGRTKLGWLLFLCLRFFKIVRGNASESECSMAEMRSVSGESLQYERYKLTAEIAVSVVDGLRKNLVYQKLISILPEDKIALYFEKLIYNEIFQLVRLLCTVRWCLRNGEEQFMHTIVWNNNSYAVELQRAWPDKMIPIVCYGSLSHFFNFQPYKSKLYNFSQDFFASLLPKKLRPIPNKKSAIAIHYAEGIDLKRRSDLFWYPDSKIEANSVLIYFDRSYNHLITKEHVNQIKAMGMRWISLCWRRNIPCNLKSVWRAPWRGRVLLTTFLKNKDFRIKFNSRTGKWLFKIGIDLLKDVEYWLAFYRMFNIKIHHDAIEAGLQNVAQNIALDIVGGVRIGKQRSEICGVKGDEFGQHPNHVYFMWNKRAQKSMEDNKNRTDYGIISGFPHDVALQKKNNNYDSMRENLLGKGAKFIIALFDNMYSPDLYYSKKMMISFYMSFLEWVINDNETGLIIKSKKPSILKNLTEIHELLKKAKITGRCLQMEDVYGRLPSDASHGADIAVGIGISSALTESVITGCKGVHCDLTRLYSHIFYKIGYEKVVFDDIDKMMVSLKRYKENPNNEPELGDWSLHLDELDPFRDGRGGERIGTYIRCLLEVFGKGGNRDEAIRNANKLYSERWGSDKVITLAN